MPLLLCGAFSFMASSATAPRFDSENLSYSINWPSGLSLGESHLTASRAKAAADGAGNLHLEFGVDAAVPGFQAQDRYRAEASGGFCSTEFDRKAQHGKKTTEEKTTFDASNETATRETNGGGKTELSVSNCAKDALTYLYYVRNELSQGRLPATQTVYFGAPYEVRLEFAGTQSIRIGDSNVDADRLTASAKGPASEINFEIFFLKDAARTPALVRVPLALGTFSMELLR
jgi:hypothetical protein